MSCALVCCNNNLPSSKMRCTWFPQRTIPENRRTGLIKRKSSNPSSIALINGVKEQPIVPDATTSFLAKSRLSNDCRNSILMTCHYLDLGSAIETNSSSGTINQKHYPDLGSASDWLNKNFPRGTTSQKHYPDLGSDTLSVWNFCARFSDVISRGDQR